MTRAEQRIRDRSDSTLGVDGWEKGFVEPDAANAEVDGPAGWAAAREEVEVRDVEAGSRMGLVNEIYEDGADAETDGGLRRDDDEGRGSGVVGPREVNQSLARLEMNSLEVKLYLDSIDKRISRMEPRLEGMRGQEEAYPPMVIQEPARAGMHGVGDLAPAAIEAEAEARFVAPVTEQAAPVTQPAMPTSERRRRAQGVPVERRRAPHAMPGEFAQDEPWGWDWRPAAGRWKPWAEQWRPSAERARVWLQERRRWVPAAALALAAALGLGIWAASGDGRPKGARGSGGSSGSQGPIEVNESNRSERSNGSNGYKGLNGTGDRRITATSAAAGAVKNSGGQKASADVPWGMEGADAARIRGGRPDLTNTAVDGRPARSSVEQGVAVQTQGVAVSKAGMVAAGMATPAGLGPAGSPGVAVTPSPNPGAGSPAAGATTMAGDASRTRDGANASGGPALTPDSADANVADAGLTKPGVSGRIIPPSGTRVHVSSGVMAGSLIYSRPPTYPRGLAGLFHTQGRVVLQAIISKSGRVENLRVISGHYMLRGAAKDAVRTWRYRPYHVNGNAVEVATIVSVEFQR